MEIEILDFFLKFKKENHLIGTLKVRLLDLGIDILGIFIEIKNQRVKVKLPYRRIDKDSFPVISFKDREKNRILIGEIASKAKEFIDKKFEFDKKSFSKTETFQKMVKKVWVDPPRKRR